jgi:hypothetical protein
MLATAATLATVSLMLLSGAGGFVAGVAYAIWWAKHERERKDNFQRLRKHQLDRITIHGDGAAIVSVRSSAMPFDQEAS